MSHRSIADSKRMLVAEKTAPEQSSFWGGEAYRVLRSDSEIGRIDLQARGGPDGVEARIRLRDRSFECRVDATVRSYQHGILSRWLMCAGDVGVHSADFDGRTTYSISGNGHLQMRRKGFFRGSYVISSKADPTEIGDIHWISGGHAVFDASVELPEDLAVFLLWIFVEIAYRSTSST